MKKFLLFALCAITSISAFAEPFSKATHKELINGKNREEYTKYCYNAEVSSESDSVHMYMYFAYIQIFQNRQLTAAEILKEAEKFKSIKNYKHVLGIAYARFGHENQALALYEETKDKSIIYWLLNAMQNKTKFDKAFELAKKYKLYTIAFDVAKLKKNYNETWQYGVKALTVTGGYDNPTKCTEIINYIFRYKPANITKQQQIAFLEQIAQMYPIPGTDFNKWKGFMGFVGFKYKALTKKDLF